MCHVSHMMCASGRAGLRHTISSLACCDVQEMVGFDVVAQLMSRKGDRMVPLSEEVRALISRPGLQLMTKHHFTKL